MYSLLRYPPPQPKILSLLRTFLDVHAVVRVRAYLFFDVQRTSLG